MKAIKVLALLVPVVLLSQGCSLTPFQRTGPGGVVKTVNGGADWQFANAIKDSSTSNLGGLNISKMEFEPSNREVVYAGSYSGGLYKSMDSGGVWERVLSKIFVYDFAIHPQDSKIIYAAGYFADFGKVLKTVDGGATWEEVYNEASGENAVRSIALNPSAPNQLIIGTSSGSLIKSMDGGLSWKLVKDFNDRVNRVLWQNGTVYVLLRSSGLKKSSDAGENFQDLTGSLTQGFLERALEGVSSNSVDSFNQVFVDPVSSRLVYLTTSRGLYKSTDEGATWNRIILPVRPEENFARAVSVARSSSNIVFASVGATIFKSTDGGGSWQTQSIPTTGFVNYILIDPQLPQIAYAGIYVP